MPRIRKEEIYEALPEVADLDKPQAMLEQWGTSMHLSRVCRMVKSNVIGNLARLFSEGRAHVHDWASNGQAPVWVKGKGENKPRPLLAPDERIRRTQASRERHKQRKAAGTVELHTPGQGVRHTAATIERAKAAPRSWISALTDMHREES